MQEPTTMTGEAGGRSSAGEEAGWVFLQCRSSRAGAQTSLLRLLRESVFRELRPFVVSSEPGWFTEACEGLGLPVLVLPFHSGRSMSGRWWRNRRWAKQVREGMAKESLRPAGVWANDHHEAALARSLAGSAKVPWVVVTRSSDMSRHDAQKHRLAESDLCFAVGKEMQGRLEEWGVATTLYREGLHAEEFAPPKPKAENFPMRWLVAGNQHPDKGWTDLMEALALLRQRGFATEKLVLDLTGREPAGGLSREFGGELRFLGRVEDFAERIREYDFAVHPSRRESYGLAPLEIAAAGVPVLGTSVGIWPEAAPDEHWCAEPRSAASLAERLADLWEGWGDVVCPVGALQEYLRKELDSSEMAREIAERLRSLGDAPGAPVSSLTRRA